MRVQDSVFRALEGLGLRICKGLRITYDEFRIRRLSIRSVGPAVSLAMLSPTPAVAAALPTGARLVTEVEGDSATLQP